MVLAVFEQLDAGDWDAARMVASRVAAIGERFGDQNLFAFALVAQGRALIKQGRVRQGLALLDEGMLPVLAGELSSPVFAGLLYCSVIDGCQEVYELRRAGSGPTRWRAGAPSSRRWSTSPGCAWCTAPRSSSSAASGGRARRVPASRGALDP